SGASVLKDEVLIKKDGSPAYNFCCVVDDSLMEITHVIRGEDHISNTPKQILMYKALGYKMPKFAHLPLIMGEDGGRLSKRTGAVAVSDYRKMGFLPEAIVNYLMLLGWSPGTNQEIVALESAVKNFSIKKVNKAAAVFSMDKLTWINGEYIKKQDPKKLAELLRPFLTEAGFDYLSIGADKVAEVVKLYQKRIPTLRDFPERAGYVFNDEFSCSTDDKSACFTASIKQAFQFLSERLKALDDYSSKSAEEAFRKLVAELNISSGDLVHPVRIVLTGSEVGPGLFETMEVLGKEKTVKRLEQAAKR
ncbi:MAG: glutamate--tRNA ligase, partial [Candidatus Omnitrophica bacterium]|nr:glutamate--tRNA ligase [Candidatus Omnitrophota bacterium]